jgi:hypothetical protein
VETRVIRVTESGYEYAVYAWKDGDGNLLSLENQLATNLYLGPDRKLFHHRIPSRFDCRTCHESNRTAIIGFDELRLNAAREGESETQLQALAAAGVFTDPLPERPARVEASDAKTREVLGYLHGNCAHCHNGSANSMSALSLEHGVALANTIDVESQGSGQASGVRIVPGSPSRSLLFQAFARESDDENIEAMPPLGVDRADEDAIEMLREWIRGLPSE